MTGEYPPYQIVGITEETRGAAEEVDRLAFMSAPPPPDEQSPSADLDLSRTYAATPTGGPPFAGLYSSYDMQLTVPAPGDGLQQVPMAGLTWVGVHPDHRRRGVLTQMMRHHFEDVRASGFALCGLRAAETTIYGRFGYAVASLETRLELGRAQHLATGDLDTDGITTTFHRSADQVEVLSDLHSRLGATTLGAAVRPASVTRVAAQDVPSQRAGGEGPHALIAWRGDEPVGYANVWRSEGWDGGRPSGSVSSREMAFADSSVELALARRLLDFDLTTSISLWNLAPDDPLVWWAGGPRAAAMRVLDGMWLRLLDLPAAMSLRGYAAEVDVVMEVSDDTCPWNAGRWRLRANGATASLERTAEAADLTTPVTALASAYLGIRSPVAMCAEGLVLEHRVGAAQELTRAMATARQPVSWSGF